MLPIVFTSRELPLCSCVPRGSPFLTLEEPRDPPLRQVSQEARYRAGLVAAGGSAGGGTYTGLSSGPGTAGR